MTSALRQSCPLAPPALGPAERGGLVVLTLLAFWLRWHGIASEALWFDELLTWRRATGPPATLVADAIAGAHYPAYFLVVAGALALLGDSVAALRAPSVLFGTLAVPLAFLAARDVHGRAAGFAAALLMAVSPFAVTYAQEARPYAMAMLLVLLALRGQVVLVRWPARRLGAWAAWVAGTAGALITLQAALLWLAASLAGFLAMHAALAPATRRAFRRELAAACGAVALVWVPWLPAMAGPVATRVAGYWVPAPSAAEVARGIGFAYLLGRLDPVAFQPLAEPAAPLGAVLAAFAAAGSAALTRRGPLLALMLAAVVLPPALLLGASLVTPAFVPRYLFAGAPAFLVLSGVGVAAALARLGRALRPAGLAVAAALALLAAAQLGPYYAAERKPRWDLAAGALEHLIGAEDRLLFGDGQIRLTVELMLSRQGRSLDPTRVLASPAALAEEEPPAGRVLVLFGRSAQHDPPRQAEIEAWFAGRGTLDAMFEFGRQVRIGAFVPAS
jgi:mannosyltransferase